MDGDEGGVGGLKGAFVLQVFRDHPIHRLQYWWTSFISCPAVISWASCEGEVLGLLACEIQKQCAWWRRRPANIERAHSSISNVDLAHRYPKILFSILHSPKLLDMDSTDGGHISERLEGFDFLAQRRNLRGWGLRCCLCWRCCCCCCGHWGPCRCAPSCCKRGETNERASALVLICPARFSVLLHRNVRAAGGAPEQRQHRCLLLRCLLCYSGKLCQAKTKGKPRGRKDFPK